MAWPRRCGPARPVDVVFRRGAAARPLHAAPQSSARGAIARWTGAARAALSLGKVLGAARCRQRGVVARASAGWLFPSARCPVVSGRAGLVDTGRRAVLQCSGRGSGAGVRTGDLRLAEVTVVTSDRNQSLQPSGAVSEQRSMS